MFILLSFYPGSQVAFSTLSQAIEDLRLAQPLFVDVNDMPMPPILRIMVTAWYVRPERNARTSAGLGTLLLQYKKAS